MGDQEDSRQLRLLHNLDGCNMICLNWVNCASIPNCCMRVLVYLPTDVGFPCRMPSPDGVGG